MLTPWLTAKMTSKKHDRARREFSKAKDSLTQLETQIETATLREWRREEQEWLAKVIDMRHHKELNNPYEPTKDKGKYL